MSMFTSLELSKKLKENGCELESEKYIADTGQYCTSEEYEEFECWVESVGKADCPTEVQKHYKAYHILEDICVRYAKEFFGKKDVLSNYEVIYDGDYEREEKEYDEAYIVHSKKILEMLQQGKDQEEIEDYIIANSVFFKKEGA